MYRLSSIIEILKRRVLRGGPYSRLYRAISQSPQHCTLRERDRLYECNDDTLATTSADRPKIHKQKITGRRRRRRRRPAVREGPPRRLPFGILSRLLLERANERGIHEWDDFRVLLISPLVIQMPVRVKRNYDALSDVICFRGADSQGRKGIPPSVNPYSAARRHLCVRLWLLLLLARPEEENNHGTLTASCIRRDLLARTPL